MKSIASRDNPTFKSLRALAEDARAVRQRGQTLLDGVHLISAYRLVGGQPLQFVVAEGALQNAEVMALLADADVPAVCLRDALFRELSSVVTPTGMVALIDLPTPPALLPTQSCVVLEAVQDGGNVGAILRTAAAAGIRDVLLGPGCAGVWTPRVLRAAQGAHFSLHLHEVSDLGAVLSQLAMPSVATVAHGGEALFALDLRGPVAWLFGNEGAGLSPALQAAAQWQACIPLAAAESLNVAAAAAVCLFEEVRQKHWCSGRTSV